MTTADRPASRSGPSSSTANRPMPACICQAPPPPRRSSWSPIRCGARPHRSPAPWCSSGKRRRLHPFPG